MSDIRKTKLFDMQKAEKYQEILATTKSILEDNPNDIYALLYAAAAYENLGNHNKAIEILKHVLSIDCMNIPAKLDLFDILYKLKNYEEAKPLLEEILCFDCDEVKNNMANYVLAKEQIDSYLQAKKEKELEFN